MAYLGNLPQRITQGDVEDLFLQNHVLLFFIKYFKFLVVDKMSISKKNSTSQLPLNML